MTADAMLKMLIGELQFQNAIYNADLRTARERVEELEKEVEKLKERKPDAV